MRESIGQGPPPPAPTPCHRAAPGGAPVCQPATTRYNKRMENETEIEKLARMVQNGFAEMHERFEKVDDRFEKIDGGLEKAEGRFTAIDKRLDVLNQKIDGVDPKRDQHRQRTKDGFSAIHRLVGGMSPTLTDPDERL